MSKKRTYINEELDRARESRPDDYRCPGTEMSVGAFIVIGIFFILSIFGFVGRLALLNRFI